MVAAWNEELRRLGFHDPHRPAAMLTPRIGEFDRDATAELVPTRLGSKRSAWNAADIRGQVEQWIAETGLVADAAVRIELAEDLTEGGDLWPGRPDVYHCGGALAGSLEVGDRLRASSSS